jgi:LIVCS family branched-chain amino acid:cation transporter
VVGQESAGHYSLAALGICLTGVLVPFLGVFAMWLFHGDTRSFFGTMGKPAAFWFPLIALSLMGPFGVAARCIVVAQGSFTLLFPKISLPLFSLFFCGAIYLATMNKSKMISLLGSILTPILLLALGVITFVGMSLGAVPESSEKAASAAFMNGFLQGYQTMDLLAAFFFSMFIIKHLERSCEEDPTHPSPTKVFLKSAAISAGLLAVIYSALVYLGSAYEGYLIGVPPQQMLGVVAQLTLGNFSAPILCLAITLACFTTATTLVPLFADFLKADVAKNKISDRVAILITLVITFLVSTLEFSGIASFLAPILEVLYPPLIVLTVMNIATKLWGTKKRYWPVLATLVAKLCFT